VKGRVAEPRWRGNSVEKEFGVNMLLPEMTLLARLLDYSLLPLEDLHDVLLHRRHCFFAFTWMKNVICDFGAVYNSNLGILGLERKSIVLTSLAFEVSNCIFLCSLTFWANLEFTASAQHKMDHLVAFFLHHYILSKY